MIVPDNGNIILSQPGDYCNPCPPNCDNVFDRVVVSYLIAGGTTISYELKDTFTDPRPYIFTLQVGQSDNQLADDWIDVGLPVTDIFYLVDGVQRLYGKVRWLFYRIKLQTPNGVYLSDPVGLAGTLPPADWRLARMAMKQELTYMKAGDGQLGYLLKRRVAGKRCPHCLDYQTQEIKQPYCPVCHGIGFECGYFFPIACVWADINPKTFHLTIDESRGTVADMAVKARMVNIWMLSEGDVFVHKTTDDRFYVHRVDNVYEFRGVPVAASVEVRMAPYSDPVYTIEIPEQMESADLLNRSW